jgi:nitrite reductase/ring-hydroxylating ferredoxin subunit
MKVIVAPLEDFESGDRRIITVGGRSIGVFRVGDRFYGIRNRGAHLAGREPGPYVAETFPVHVEEDYVVIDA